MDMKRIPILSLSSVTSLSNILEELPLPTANPDIVNQSLCYGQDVFNEATSVLQPSNIHFLESLRKALENTTTDEIKLKEPANHDKFNMDSIPCVFKKIILENPDGFRKKLGFQSFFSQPDSKKSDIDSVKLKDKTEKSKKKKKKHKDGKDRKAQQKIDAESYTVANRRNGMCLTLKKMKELQEDKVHPIENLKTELVVEASDVSKTPRDINVFNDPNITNSSGASANTSLSSLDLNKTDTKTPIDASQNTALIETVDNFNTGKSTSNADDDYYMNISHLNQQATIFDSKKIFDSTVVMGIASQNISADDFLDPTSFKSNPNSNSLSVSELKMTDAAVKDSILGMDSANNSPLRDDSQTYQTTSQQFGLAAYLSKTNTGGSGAAAGATMAAVGTGGQTNSTADSHQPGSCTSMGQHSVDNGSLHDSTPLHHQLHGPNSALSIDNELYHAGSGDKKRTKVRNKELENLMRWQIKDKGMPKHDPLDCTTVGPGERVKKRTRRCVKRNEREDCSSISENSYQTNDVSPQAVPDFAQAHLSLKSESSMDEDLKPTCSPIVAPSTCQTDLAPHTSITTAIPQHQSMSSPCPSDIFNLTKEPPLTNGSVTVSKDSDNAQSSSCLPLPLSSQHDPLGVMDLPPCDASIDDLQSHLDLSLSPTDPCLQLPPHDNDQDHDRQQPDFSSRPTSSRASPTKILKGKKVPGSNIQRSRLASRAPSSIDHTYDGLMKSEIVTNLSDDDDSSVDNVSCISDKLKSRSNKTKVSSNKKKTKKAKKIPSAIKNISQTDSRLQNLFASREAASQPNRDRIFRHTEYSRNMNPLVLMTRLEHTGLTGVGDSYDSDSSTSSSATIPFTIADEMAAAGTLLPAHLEAASQSRNQQKRCDKFRATFFSFLDCLLKKVEELDLLSIASRQRRRGLTTDDGGGQEDEDGDSDEGLEVARLSTRNLRILNEFVAKMKQMAIMSEIPVGKLVRLLTLLLVNMNSPLKVLKESKKRLQKMQQEQLLSCLDASLIALSIMISPDMPRAIFLEDVIEQATDLFRTVLRHLIYPFYDSGYQRNGTISSADVMLSTVSSISLAKNNADYVGRLLERVQCGINCLTELLSQKPNRLADEAVLKITALGLSGCQVNNIVETQMALLPLLSSVFSQYEGHRKSIISDILSMLTHNQTKKPLKNYRINTDEEVQVISATILILFQSMVQKPATNKKSNTNKATLLNDGVVENSVLVTFNSSVKIMQIFVQTFFKKVCLKGEDSYKVALERLVADLCVTFNKPEWPAANFLLHCIGNVVVYHLTAGASATATTSGGSTSSRAVAIELLGTLCGFLARQAAIWPLRRSPVPPRPGGSLTDPVLRMDDILVDMVRANSLSESHIALLLARRTEDKAALLRQLLLNFLALDTSDSTCMYARRYAVALCLQDALGQESMATEGASRPDDEYRNSLLAQLGPAPTPIELPMPLVISYETACAICRLLNLTKDLDCFELYLSKICKCLDENSVPIRTKSMRSLAQVLEEDPSLLAKGEIEKSVNRRFLDSSIAVREATIDLVGRFLAKRPELVQRYYPTLITRIADTGTSVRKRVIKVLWDICSTNNDFPQTTDAYAKIMRRFYDEESVKKLVNDVFKNIWFTPVSDRDPVKLQQRIFNIADVVDSFSSDQKYNHNAVLQFITQLSKTETEQNSDHKAQKNFEKSIQQIIECLVQTVVRLQELSSHSTDVEPHQPGSKAASLHSNSSGSGGGGGGATGQRRLCSTWSALHILARVRPRLVWPYLSQLSGLLRQLRAPHPTSSTTSSSSTSSSGTGSSLKHTLLINNEMAICMNHLCGTLDAGLAAAHGYSLEHGSINLSRANLVDIADDLISLAVNAPKRFIVDSAIKCLCRVTGFTRHYATVQTNFSRFFSKVLLLSSALKAHFQQQQILPSKDADSKQTCLFRMSYTCVVLWRYFNKDDLLGPDLMDKSSTIFKDLLDITMYFAKIAEVRDRIVSNMNHLVHKDHSLLIRGPIHDFYIVTLQLVRGGGGDSTSRLTVAACKTVSLVLDNISNFLKHNELKMVEENSNWKTKNQAESLKETHDLSSSFGNVVAQKYLELVLDCCMVGRAEVRSSALNLICKILSQGLVQPLSTIAHLVALQGDQDHKIKFKADTQLNEINNKYQGYLPMKALAGLRLSYRLQKTMLSGRPVPNSDQLRPPVRGWHIGSAATGNVQAVNHQLYSMLRRHKQHWRSFLDSILNQLQQQPDDEDIMLELDERMFLVDQLAAFPYQVQEEPVFLVHRLDLQVGVAGQTALRHTRDVFKVLSRPIAERAYKDGELSPNELTILARLLADTASMEQRRTVYGAALSSRLTLLLLALRHHLRAAYGIQDSKLSNYSPSQTNKQLDKAICRNVNANVFEMPAQCVSRLPPAAVLCGSPDSAEPGVLAEAWRQMVLDFLHFRNTLLQPDSISGVGAAAGPEADKTESPPQDISLDTVLPVASSNTGPVNHKTAVSAPTSTIKNHTGMDEKSFGPRLSSTTTKAPSKTCRRVPSPAASSLASPASTTASPLAPVTTSSKKRPRPPSGSVAEKRPPLADKQTEQARPRKKTGSSTDKAAPPQSAAAPRLTLTSLPSDFTASATSHHHQHQHHQHSSSSARHKPSSSHHYQNNNNNKSFKSSAPTGAVLVLDDDEDQDLSRHKRRKHSADLLRPQPPPPQFPRKNLFKPSVKTIPNLVTAAPKRSSATVGASSPRRTKKRKRVISSSSDSDLS